MVNIAFDAHPLVHLNAGLNALATVLLVVGYCLIKRGAAPGTWLGDVGCVCSVVFVLNQLPYVPLNSGAVEFTQPGVVKAIYLSILFSHIILAATVPFLAAGSIVYAVLGHGFSGSADMPTEQRLRYLTRHRRLSKWTLPIWLYVSVTGVVVYVMLYHIWPPTTG